LRQLASPPLDGRLGKPENQILDWNK